MDIRDTKDIIDYLYDKNSINVKSLNYHSDG